MAGEAGAASSNTRKIPILCAEQKVERFPDVERAEFVLAGWSAQWSQAAAHFRRQAERRALRSAGRETDPRGSGDKPRNA